MSAADEHTIGLEDAARYLGMSPSTLCRRARAGDVPAYKPGRRWMFLPSEIQQYLRASAPVRSRALRVVKLEGPASELALEIRRARRALLGRNP